MRENTFFITLYTLKIKPIAFYLLRFQYCNEYSKS